MLLLAALELVIRHLFGCAAAEAAEAEGCPPPHSHEGSITRDVSFCIDVAARLRFRAIINFCVNPSMSHLGAASLVLIPPAKWSVYTSIVQI